MKNPYSKAFWASLTPEQRSERARKAALTRHSKLTPEERKIIASKMSRIRWGKKK